MAGFNLRNTVDGIVDYKRKWDNAKATGKDTSEFEKGAAVYYKELRDNGRGDVADYLQKSDSITAGEYLKQLQPEYGVDAASLQKKSDTLFNEGIRDKNQLNADFDKVYDNNINVDPTSTGYGKNILTGYGIAADEAYKGTLGGNAADNGGNVDSFAAANANRQKAAVLSQGYGDVLGYYNTIAGQANQWATNKGNTVGAYLAQLQGNVDADRDVTKKAFEGTVDLWKTQDTNKTEKEVAELGAEISREQMAQEKLIADEANMTELLVQQLKNDAKSGSSGKIDIIDEPNMRGEDEDYKILTGEEEKTGKPSLNTRAELGNVAYEIREKHKGDKLSMASAVATSDYDELTKARLMQILGLSEYLM